MLKLDLLKQPATLSGALVLCAATAGVLIWSDNPTGFRDAGAFADLVAAVFSMIASALLFVALLIQSRELRLQREELALQREQIQSQAEETRRLADYNDSLAQSAKTQDIVSFKQYALDEVRDVFSVNENRFLKLYSDLSRVKISKEDRARRNVYGHNPFYAEIINYHVDGYVISVRNTDNKEERIYNVDYCETRDIFDAVKPLGPLLELIDEADGLGIGHWMISRLPFRTETKSLTSDKIRLILTALTSLRSK